MPQTPPAYVGTAAWTIPKVHRDQFGAGESQLAVYASRFSAVEINSSFHRDHRPMTYARWRDTVPAHFRFSVKLSKFFTHTHGLNLVSGEAGPNSRAALVANIAAILELQQKLGVLLVQLPPKLEFSLKAAETFFGTIRESYAGAIALEPRNISWDLSVARKFSEEFGLSRVLADPQPYFNRNLGASDVNGLIYMRLHGSPAVYRSSYEDQQLTQFTNQILRLADPATPVWCIFDNTTLGHATPNALAMKDLLVGHSGNSASLAQQNFDLVSDEFAGRFCDVQSVRH